MRLFVSCRMFFAITMIASLAMICSEANARGGRGGGGGGRAGGGRASGGGRSHSSRPSGGSSRAGGAISNSGSHAGQFGSGQFGGQGNLSSRAGGLSSGLAGKSQLQGMLGQQAGNLQSGQLSGKFSDQNTSDRNASERNGQHQQNAQTKANDFQNGSQPFSASWYAQHPNAWQATHPHAGAAAVATTATVAAWVGTGYYAQAGSGDSSTTIIYEAAPEESGLATAPATNATYAAPAQPANAEAWFPVGIYQVATSKDAPALRMLQLVVDHQGTLRGVYYDSITDTTHNIVGTLDPSTKLAQWRLDSSSKVTFQASLNELTQSVGTLQVNAPAGPQKWLLARVESQP